ncbi:hypothetical protein MKW92_023998, partial [Papaver armeniacum]
MAPTLRKAGKYLCKTMALKMFCSCSFSTYCARKKWTTRRMFYSFTFSSACTRKKRCGRPCENSMIKKGGSDYH